MTSIKTKNANAKNTDFDEEPPEVDEEDNYESDVDDSDEEDDKSINSDIETNVDSIDSSSASNSGSEDEEEEEEDVDVDVEDEDEDDDDDDEDEDNSDVEEDAFSINKNNDGIKDNEVVDNVSKKSKKVSKSKKKDVFIEDSEDSISDDEDENYLNKFDDSIRKNIINEYYPEMMMKNNEEIETLCKIIRDSNGNIIDPFHKTLPFLTKYEKARVLGERTLQINEGSSIFVNVGPDIIDGYLIALKEFEEKKIPFIIQRPLPNGSCEYWRLSDLEII